MYAIRSYYELHTVDFLPILGPQETLQNVCFVYTLYPNGSSSYYAVEDEKKFYLFDAYMYPTRITTNYAEVTEFFDTSKRLPTNEQDYDH